jgi:hypothetical protein
MDTTYYWTGKNNSTYLRTRRMANSKRQAVREALNFLREELMGEGQVAIFTGEREPHPTIIFERSIHTSMQCKRREEGKKERTIKL